MGLRNAPQKRRFSLYIFITCCVGACYFLFATNFLAPPQQKPISPGIPPQIWHIFFDNDQLLGRLRESIQSWITKNRNTGYTLMGNQGADEFVKKHYFDKPEILETFLDLKYPISAQISSNTCSLKPREAYIATWIPLPRSPFEIGYHSIWSLSRKRSLALSTTSVMIHQALVTKRDCRSPSGR